MPRRRAARASACTSFVTRSGDPGSSGRPFAADGARSIGLYCAVPPSAIAIARHSACRRAISGPESAGVPTGAEARRLFAEAQAPKLEPWHDEPVRPSRHGVLRGLAGNDSVSRTCPLTSGEHSCRHRSVLLRRSARPERMPVVCAAPVSSSHCSAVAPKQGPRRRPSRPQPRQTRRAGTTSSLSSRARRSW